MTSVLRYLTGFFSADTLQPGLIQKLDGSVWLVNPDGSETQLPGGGGNVTNAGQQTFSGADVTVPANSSAKLTWDNASGDNLLDPSSPSDPQIVEPGLYAFTLTARGDSNLTVGANFDMRVNINSPSYQANFSSTVAVDNEQAPDVTITVVWFCDQFADVTVHVQNNDSADGQWLLDAYVQKIG